MQHSVWSEEELHGVQKTHVEIKDVADVIAFNAVKVARWAFDTFSLYRFGSITTGKVLNRAIFLETVAGVPGMVRSQPLQPSTALPRTCAEEHLWGDSALAC